MSSDLGDDNFAMEVLRAIGLRDLLVVKVNADIARKLKALGLIETVDVKPGSRNHIKGKYVYRITAAGKARLA